MTRREGKKPQYNYGGGGNIQYNAPFTVMGHV